MLAKLLSQDVDGASFIGQDLADPLGLSLGLGGPRLFARQVAFKAGDPAAQGGDVLGACLRGSSALAKSLELKWYEPAFELPELTETLIWHERNEADASYIWIRERIKAVASAFTRESPNKREGARLSVIS